MKNSTVSSGKSRSKISSVGVGHPRNRRRRAIVKSIASPASTPAQNPQVSVFNQSLRFGESHDELDISVKPAGQFTWNSGVVLGFVLESQRSFGSSHRFYAGTDCFYEAEASACGITDRSNAGSLPKRNWKGIELRAAHAFSSCVA